MAAVELTSADDGVLQITLRRPEALNALNYPMVLDFLAVLDAVESRASLRAVILTRTGRGFWAALALRGDGAAEGVAEQGQIRGLLPPQQQIAGIPVRRHQLPVPVIVAVN